MGGAKKGSWSKLSENSDSEIKRSAKAMHLRLLGEAWLFHIISEPSIEIMSLITMVSV
jgi:hypothetical protein